MDDLTKYKKVVVRDIVQFCEGGPGDWMAPEQWKMERVERLEFLNQYESRPVRMFRTAEDLTGEAFVDSYQDFERPAFADLVMGSSTYWPEEESE